MPPRNYPPRSGVYIEAPPPGTPPPPDYIGGNGETDCSSASPDAIATQFSSSDIHINLIIPHVTALLHVTFLLSLLSGPRGVMLITTAAHPQS